MSLETQTAVELVGRYNAAATSLGRNEVKRFSDHKSAVRRTKQIITDLKAQKGGTTERKKRGMRFVFPFHGRDNLRVIKSENSLRGRCAALLKSDGGTYKDVIKLVHKFDKDRGSTPGNVEHRAYELIRLLHYYIGFGLRQNADGKIFIHTNG